MNNSVSTYCNMHTMHTLASIHSTTTRVAISMHTTLVVDLAMHT